MKVSQAVDFYLQYHRANSKKIPLKPVSSFSLALLHNSVNVILPAFPMKRYWAFLLSLIKNNKQAIKRNRYSVLSSFYNFSINTALPALTNPCNTAVIKKIFKQPHAIQWQTDDKDTVDEIIFRTTNRRNRLMLELMARGGGESRGSPEPYAIRYLTWSSKNGRIIEVTPEHELVWECISPYFCSENRGNFVYRVYRVAYE
jgi:hypothetical protein